MTIGELFSEIWQSILKSATAVGDGVKAVGGFIGDGASAAGDAIGEGAKAVGEGAGKAMDAVKGLFK